MKSRHAFAIATALCLILPALPVEAEIDRDRMRQDLDIMEGILKSLHAQNKPDLGRIHLEPHVRGLYFENYGVIFLIEERRLARSGTSGVGSFRRLLAASEKTEESKVVEDIRAKLEERRHMFRERLGDFLGMYADGIRQLEEDNRITILVHFEPLSLSLYHINLDQTAARISDKTQKLRAITRQLPYDSLSVRLRTGGRVRQKLRAITRRLTDDSLSVRLRPRGRVRMVPKAPSYNAMSEQIYSEITARKGDVVAYRRERISEAEFKKRIVSREHTPDASTLKKIGVMAAIMDKVLKHPNHSLSDFDKTLGIYKKGLGALFLVNAESGYRPDYRVTIDGEEASVILRRRTGKAVKGDSERKDQLVEDVVNVVGDYGYSLRTLKPSESIVVDVRFPKRMRRKPSDPRGLVLMVKKQDVDAYTRKDLDLAAFREKVDIQEY